MDEQFLHLSAAVTFKFNSTVFVVVVLVTGPKTASLPTGPLMAAVVDFKLTSTAISLSFLISASALTICPASSMLYGLTINPWLEGSVTLIVGNSREATLTTVCPVTPPSTVSIGVPSTATWRCYCCKCWYSR